MKNAIAYVLAFLTLVVVLTEIGVDVKAFLVSAGVLGLAVGLGAQTLIKDVISGFFILFEGLIRVDDMIEVGPHTGQVEAIGLRVTKMRMLNGALRVIPNGELTAVREPQQGLGAGRRRRRRRVRDRRAARAGGHGAHRRRMGARDGTVARAAAGPGHHPLRGFRPRPAARASRSRPTARFDAEVGLRRRIKEAFEREGIKLPTPQRVVYLRGEASSSGAGDP